MQKQCPQCGRQFDSYREGEGELCPQCARGSFRRAEARQTASPEWEKQQRDLMRKQEARARRMGRIDLEKKGMSPGRIVLLFLGAALMATASLLFWISARSETGLLANMPPGNQLAFSLFLNALAAILLFLGLRRHFVLAIVCAAGALAWGWFVPVLWPSGFDSYAMRSYLPEPEKKAQESSTLLSDKDLSILAKAREEQGEDRVWGIYIESPLDGAREQIRRFIGRISQAKRTVAYSRHQGLLYVLEGTQAKEADIRALASMLGRVVSVAPERRLVEVHFDARESHYENEFDPEVLLNMEHPAFVRANLNELRCLDSARIVTAAENLEGAHTGDFQSDIRQTLLDVLQQPWSGQEYVQAALVRALLVYADSEDARALAESRRLFETLTAANLSTPETVVTYLVDNDPDYMVTPLLKLWMENPVYWDPYLAKLGARVQPDLLRLLDATQNLQLIGGILKHLEGEGTAEALPAVRRFLNHQDSLIRKAAHEAETEIAARAHAGKQPEPSALPSTGDTRR